MPAGSQVPKTAAGDYHTHRDPGTAARLSLWPKQLALQGTPVVPNTIPVLQVHAQLLVLEACGWFADQTPAAYICIKTHDGQHHVFSTLLDATIKFVWQNRMLQLKEFYKHFLSPIFVANADAPAAAPAAAAAAMSDVSNTPARSRQQQQEQPSGTKVSADYTPTIKAGKPVLHAKKGIKGKVLDSIDESKARVLWDGGQRAKAVACAHLRVQPLKKGTTQVPPTAQQQRVLVVGGDYTGLHGTVMSIANLRCKVQLDEGQVASIEVSNLHTDSSDNQSGSNAQVG